MKFDLKDAFFSVPIGEKLQRRFAFQWGVCRYVRTRLPQGWNWSPIFFHETAAHILQGTGAINYADDILLGAETPEELFQHAELVFERLVQYGLKLNFRKVQWCAKDITFLGYTIGGGQISLRKYLQKWQLVLGKLRSIAELERVIGILSYCCKSIRRVEEVLAPLRQWLK